MPKQVQITPEVRAVLERCTSVANVLFLPPGQLDKPLYQAVNKVLTALGGKWDRKSGGHLFAGGFGDQLKEALEAGVAVDAKRTAEQFFTPPAIAADVYSRACVLPRHHVLEPSAGIGALLVQAITARCDITAVDSDPKCVEALKTMLGPVAGAEVRCADFLTLARNDFRPVDRVLMNPPFGKGADMMHVSLALDILEPGGVLVAIMSPHWTFAESKAAQIFRGLVNDHSHDWTPLPEGSFKSSGTGVNTGILTIRKGTI